jgi:penicillin G amidase
MRRFLLLLLVFALVGSYFGYRFVSQQGRDSVDWSKPVAGSQVKFDSLGIPTIEGKDWPSLAEAQGFVVASDRLWQMDLMRRSASGRLSEWFGPQAFNHDEGRRKEDWQGVAERAALQFPEPEKAFCDSFARGVTQFIERSSKKWGVEYLLLGATPEPWTCTDSVLILLSMVDDLSSVFESEGSASVWRKFLPVSWENFLYTQEHPWNVVLLGKNKKTKPVVLPEGKLPMMPISAAEKSEPHLDGEFFPGSNAWVARNEAGVWVANDPHLSTSVPQLWYPIRMRVANEWVAGVSLPGIPGIVIGRNETIGWGFTNVKEDIDDLLEEELSEDGKKYVESRGSKGAKKWKEVQELPYTIRARGADDRTGTARFTHRGPLTQVASQPGKTLSRQWLALKPGNLRIPTLALMRSKDWESFNNALDDFPLPAQAAVYGHKDGSIGLRVSGRGVKRKKSGLVVQLATDGEWLGMAPVAERPRVYIPAGKDAAYLSTANQRLWLSDYGHHWSSDLRQDRIRTVLSDGTYTRKQMLKLQHDTQSRFSVQLLAWVRKHAKPKNPAQEKILSRWESWDGFVESSEKVFAEAIWARKLFSQVLIGRARFAFLPEAAKSIPYEWKIQTGWQLAAMEASGTEVFGIQASDLATWILDEIEAADVHTSHFSNSNRWRAQHPFVKGIPWLGWLFAVDEMPQVGYDGVVRVERPKTGASTRVVWDLREADGGSWSFPVGASGHVLSKDYKSFRKLWADKSASPVWVD